jgi:hypothetical protein
LRTTGIFVCKIPFARSCRPSFREVDPKNHSFTVAAGEYELRHALALTPHSNRLRGCFTNSRNLRVHFVALAYVLAHRPVCSPNARSASDLVASSVPPAKPVALRTPLAATKRSCTLPPRPDTLKPPSHPVPPGDELVQSVKWAYAAANTITVSSLSSALPPESAAIMQRQFDFYVVRSEHCDGADEIVGDVLAQLPPGTLGISLAPVLKNCSAHHTEALHGSYTLQSALEQVLQRHDIHFIWIQRNTVLIKTSDDSEILHDLTDRQSAPAAPNAPNSPPRGAKPAQHLARPRHTLLAPAPDHSCTCQQIQDPVGTSTYMTGWCEEADGSKSLVPKVCPRGFAVDAFKQP